MKTATVKLKSKTPYSQSKFHQEPFLEKESKDDYAIRTWRAHLHISPSTGNVVIPPMCFKNCMSDAAKYLAIQIPGKGKSTYTKHVEAGIMVIEPMDLGIKPEDVPSESLFLPSDGKRGGGKRVIKTFPIIHQWSGTVVFEILDETITQDVFHDILQQAGNFIGIGRFRPRNNGYYGRFSLESMTWK